MSQVENSGFFDGKCSLSGGYDQMQMDLLVTEWLRRGYKYEYFLQKNCY